MPTQSQSNSRGERGRVTDDAGSIPDARPAESQLHSTIEHTLLQTKVAALERELRTHRQRHAVVLEQYERILEERTCRCSTASDPTAW